MGKTRAESTKSTIPKRQKGNRGMRNKRSEEDGLFPLERSLPKSNARPLPGDRRKGEQNRKKFLASSKIEMRGARMSLRLVPTTERGSTKQLLLKQLVLSLPVGFSHLLGILKKEFGRSKRENASSKEEFGLLKRKRWKWRTWREIIKLRAFYKESNSDCYLQRSIR
ncbi:hypothetical protein SDJN03_05794, partial [Cucurbita argyrosperma subsp. sororia]